MTDEIVEGMDELLRKLYNLEDSVAGENLGKAMLAGGFVLEGVIKESMGQQKHGRQYGSHVASAPGEAPAIDLGALVNTIHTTLVSATPTQAEAQVSTNAEYGPALEFGSAHAAARPFMRPAADEHEDEVNGAAAATLKRLIDGAANA